MTIIAEFLPFVNASTRSSRAGCPLFAPVASDCYGGTALYPLCRIDPNLTIDFVFEVATESIVR